MTKKDEHKVLALCISMLYY